MSDEYNADSGSNEFQTINDHAIAAHRARFAESQRQSPGSDCEECGESINPKRLEIMPHARYCVHCAELVDNNRRHFAVSS